MDTLASNFLIVLFVLSVSINAALIFVIFRLSKKLLQFDELFDLLSEDIDTNIKYFKKLLSTPLFEASQEVRTANKNMEVMSLRLEEFSLRFDELSNREKSIKQESPNPPKVI